MSDVFGYAEKTFDETGDFGDNTDRVNFIMMQPTLGQTSLLRYSVPTGKRARAKCLAVTCDYGGLFLSGAYATAQDGARLQVRFASTVKLEHKMNWVGLSGYIGGADDYNAENELMISGYDMEIAANTVIDVYVTGGTNVRRMIYAELYGTLDDGTKVKAAAKQAVTGVIGTVVSLYTVPAGRTLYWDLLVVKTRHIDLYAGKAYLMFNGLPAMVFDLMQGQSWQIWHARALGSIHGPSWAGSGPLPASSSPM